MPGTFSGIIIFAIVTAGLCIILLVSFIMAWLCKWKLLTDAIAVYRPAVIENNKINNLETHQRHNNNDMYKKLNSWLLDPFLVWWGMVCYSLLSVGWTDVNEDYTDYTVINEFIPWIYGLGYYRVSWTFIGCARIECYRCIISKTEIGNLVETNIFWWCH